MNELCRFDRRRRLFLKTAADAGLAGFTGSAGPDSKLIDDPIGRISVSDSTFKVATSTTSTFPFGDQIQAVQALALKNVVRNGMKLPDGNYSAP